VTRLSGEGDSNLQSKNKKLLAVLLGWAFVALGVVGVVLPILPGIPLLFVGLLVLSSEYVWAHHLLGKIRERFPAASRKARQWVGVPPCRGDRP
jgi:uncharacterized membrane protein YbaN (DUF454 family)